MSIYTHRETRDGVTIRNHTGKRHNRDLFRWLMRRTLGNGTTMRGTIDSRTGRVRFSVGRKGGAPCR